MSFDMPSVYRRNLIWAGGRCTAKHVGMLVLAPGRGGLPVKRVAP